MYIWQSSLWPVFTYNQEVVSDALGTLNYKKGQADTYFQVLSHQSKQLYYAETLSDEIMNSSGIENVDLNYDSVFSSVLRQLDVNQPIKAKPDQNAKSVSEMVFDACNNNGPLTEERLFKWHRLLFDGLGKKLTPKHIGCYRKEPVYVIRSTPKSHEVMYEAVPTIAVQNEMNRLLDYVNKENSSSPIVKSAIASFWFVSIHPFGDGNGRISRAVADYILQENNQDFCYCSMSSAILKNKKSYYEILQKTQTRDSMDITEWILWFISTYSSSLENAANVCKRKMRTVMIMQCLDPNEFNSRQLYVLYKLADGSFFGKLNAAKWMKMTKCQSATATRDLKELVEKSILIRLGDSSKTFYYVLNPSFADSV